MALWIGKIHRDASSCRLTTAKNTVGQPWLSAVGELVGLPWRKARYSSLGSGPPQRETPIREIRGVAEAATLPELTATSLPITYIPITIVHYYHSSPSSYISTRIDDFESEWKLKWKCNYILVASIRCYVDIVFP
ncbi:Cohesin loading complex subunit A [Vespula squamosa]|uniref:Cohesin loading complex subunit A n=1 Tax=Vespula squamosa TaxID=30214 RepID=A0ABD2A6Y5_VESSQ